MEKVTTYWRVRSGEDADAKPHWTQIDEPPETRVGLHGELRVENDDQVMVVYFEDAVAHEHVTRAARDAAALVREHEIPHRPGRRPDS